MILKQQLLLAFEQHNASLKDTEAGIIRQLTDIDKKPERLEERFIQEELTAELYHKYKAKFEAEKQDLSTQMSHNRIELSKLEDFISVALMFSINLSKMWILGDYTQRQEPQNTLFEDGIVYDRQKDEYRSTGNNEFVSDIVDLSKDMATLNETDSRNFNPSSPSSGFESRRGVISHSVPSPALKRMDTQIGIGITGIIRHIFICPAG